MNMFVIKMKIFAFVEWSHWSPPPSPPQIMSIVEHMLHSLYNTCLFGLCSHSHTNNIPTHMWGGVHLREVTELGTSTLGP